MKRLGLGLRVEVDVISSHLMYCNELQCNVLQRIAMYCNVMQW